MKAIFLTATLFAVLAKGASAQAMNHDAMGNTSKALPAPAASSMTDGVVTKVDPAAGTITLKHEAVKPVGMQAMTMAYKVKDAALLRKVAAGNKVGFSLEKQKDQYLVDAIEPKK